MEAQDVQLKPQQVNDKFENHQNDDNQQEELVNPPMMEEQHQSSLQSNDNQDHDNEIQPGKNVDNHQDVQDESQSAQNDEFVESKTDDNDHDVQSNSESDHEQEEVVESKEEILEDNEAQSDHELESNELVEEQEKNVAEEENVTESVQLQEPVASDNSVEIISEDEAQQPNEEIVESKETIAQESIKEVVETKEIIEVSETNVQEQHHEEAVESNDSTEVITEEHQEEIVESKDDSSQEDHEEAVQSEEIIEVSEPNVVQEYNEVVESKEEPSQDSNKIVESKEELIQESNEVIEPEEEPVEETNEIVESKEDLVNESLEESNKDEEQQKVIETTETSEVKVDEVLKEESVEQSNVIETKEVCETEVTNDEPKETEITSDQLAKTEEENTQKSLNVDLLKQDENQMEESRIYHIKWIGFHDKKVPIVTQNLNGPCPLLAIINVLLLRGKITLPDSAEVISEDNLIERLGSTLFEIKPPSDTERSANFHHNVDETITTVLPQLSTGLDVNVKFTGDATGFEYTANLAVFDLLDIHLYHGWLCDPQDKEAFDVVKDFSYNQITSKIIADRESEDVNMRVQALIAEKFLNDNQSQLTYHGLCVLNSQMKDKELAVFFRNNHFSTILKENNELFLLVTDQGFLKEYKVVWETLSSVDGSGHFVDNNFVTFQQPETEVKTTQPDPKDDSTQLVSDRLLARNLAELDPEGSESWQKFRAENLKQNHYDAELAKSLQQEENMKDEQVVKPQEPEASSGETKPTSSKGKSCLIM